MTNTKIKTRDLTIDVLRALSIVVMMVMHVNAYYLNDKLSLFVWSYGQWVVPAFLLCSFAVGKYEVTSVSEYMSYLKKRLNRILVPYYIWLIFYLLIIYLFKHNISLDYIIKNIFLLGGSDFNWLVLLFVYLTVFGPFIYIAANKNFKWLLIIVLSGLAISLSTFFNQKSMNVNYRIFMLPAWISITTLLLYCLRLYKERQYIHVLTITFSSLLIFLLFYFFAIARMNYRLDLYFHKYPPNIYFYVFCIWSTMLFYFVSEKIAQFVQRSSVYVEKILEYISAKSYEIFFAHIVVLYIIDNLDPRRHLTYQQFLLIMFVSTFVCVYVLGLFKHSFAAVFMRMRKT
ncbi:MAG: acyltransferase [Patescibacteria group bacterium]